MEKNKELEFFSRQERKTEKTYPQTIAFKFTVLKMILFKKYKTCKVCLSSYRNTSGSLGEREMLWEHEQQASVSTAFSSSPKLLRYIITLW